MQIQSAIVSATAIDAIPKNATTTGGANTLFQEQLIQEKQLQHADYSSGRLGISLSSQGVPASVVYFNQDGTPATRTAFNAEAILRHTEKFNIPLSDLTALGTQLSADNVGYLPYQLYPEQGSNHGIDFDDLVNGGMGTAYNWGIDANVLQKGPTAVSQLADAQAFIQRRGLISPNGTQPVVTTVDQNTATASEVHSAPITPIQQQQLQHADYISGRLGISLNSQGVPASVVYFNQDGTPATRTAFNAEAILRHTEKFDIPLDDLTELGTQLSADNVGYLPYQLYPEQGSNHGIDFDDLINGGMGTAYNWGVDSNVDKKGPTAIAQLQDAQALIARRELTYSPALNNSVMTETVNTVPPTSTDSVINNQDLAALRTRLGELNLQQNPEIAAHLQTLLDLIGQDNA